MLMLFYLYLVLIGLKYIVYEYFFLVCIKLIFFFYLDKYIENENILK